MMSIILKRAILHNEPNFSFGTEYIISVSSALLSCEVAFDRGHHVSATQPTSLESSTFRFADVMFCMEGSTSIKRCAVLFQFSAGVQLLQLVERRQVSLIPKHLLSDCLCARVQSVCFISVTCTSRHWHIQATVWRKQAKNLFMYGLCIEYFEIYIYTYIYISPF